jgi:UDP-N-acetylglucosamine 2-epimerase (non-hydrolysing)
MVGDVMVDALRLVLPGAERKSTILDELKLKKDGYLLCTVHRAANTEEERLKKIVKALLEVKETVVFPVHPRTRKALRQYGLMRKLRLSRTVRVTEPVGYLESLVLQRNARLVLTDSGGIQKEAYILGTPCLTLRDETEWTETVESGWNVLVGTDCVRILHAIRDFQPSRRRLALFGDGNSSVKIASVLSKVRTGHDKGK